jgi:GT2 family glycosyltransferase
MVNDQRPLASVIVLGYNDKKYLESCLSSLLDQDMPARDYEVIYADNASTDGSADFVTEQFPAVRVLCLDRNYGFAEGNNRAAEAARGRYVAFQNCDTVAHRRWLPELIKAMQSAPEIRACHPAALPLNLGGYHEREALIEEGVMCELTPSGRVGFTRVPLNGGPIPTLFIFGGSFLIDSDIIDELRYYFDPTYFIYNEDTDLGLRINNLGYTVVFVRSALVYHERDPSRRLRLNRKSTRMGHLVTRNRFITYFKNMYGLEYLLALPLLFLGSITKVRTLELGLGSKALFVLGFIPYSLFSLLVAAARFPRYVDQRRYILSNSQRGRFWLLGELLKRRRPIGTPTT